MTMFSGNGLSGRSENLVTGWLVGVRLIPQRLKLGIMEFATGKSVTPDLELCPPGMTLEAGPLYSIVKLCIRR